MSATCVMQGLRLGKHVIFLLCIDNAVWNSCTQGKKVESVATDLTNVEQRIITTKIYSLDSVGQYDLCSLETFLRQSFFEIQRHDCRDKQASKDIDLKEYIAKNVKNFRTGLYLKWTQAKCNIPTDKEILNNILNLKKQELTAGSGEGFRALVKERLGVGMEDDCPESSS